MSEMKLSDLIAALQYQLTAHGEHVVGIQIGKTKSVVYDIAIGGSRTIIIGDDLDAKTEEDG